MMLKKNDMVMVCCGRDKGKTGKIIEIFPDSLRARVEKLNMIKRHQRPTPKMRQGGILEKEASIHVSNLMLYCPKCSKATRLNVKIKKDGGKVRVCKKCKEEI